MRFLHKKGIKFPLLLILLFLLSIKPYNWYCASSGSCSAINLLNYLPHKKGTTQVTLEFKTRNPYPNVLFELDSNQDFQIKTLTGTKNTIKYRVKNNSKDTIIFRPKLVTEPTWLVKYIERESCLCHQEYELKPQEEEILEANLRISVDIEEDEIFLENPQRVLTIRYDMK